MRRVLACLGVAAVALLAAQPAAAASQSGDEVGPLAFGQPVINEVQTRGAAGPMDQFFEVANPSRTDTADLSGWFVQIYSSTDALLQIVIIPDGTVLQPLGAAPAAETLWTLSSVGFTGGAVDQPGAITIDVPSNGGVALFNPNGIKVDGVAFSAGATTPLEGTALAPQLASLDPLNPAYGRNIVSQDTDSNRPDFSLLSRSPEQLN